MARLRAISKLASLTGVLVMMLGHGSPAGAARALQTAAGRTDLRTGPTEEHVRVTVLPAGIPLWAVDYKSGFYCVQLSALLHAWVHETQVTPLDRAVAQPAPCDITDISSRGSEQGTVVSLTMANVRPWRVRQELDPPTLKLDLFGVRLRHYGVRQLPDDRCVWAIEARQIADDWAELTFRLLFHQQRGWQVSFRDGQLMLLIRDGYQEPGLEGKLIVIDPGHGGPDSGAVGPTGLKEKDVNLAIALRLAELLRSSGARVKLLRTADTSVGPAGAGKREELEARLAASEHLDADFFLSIHNNAIGGGDPARAYGTETYYYTPMSILPARILQDHLCAALGTKNRFISWRPFYVLRQTDVPRVLVECAYVSNPAEERRLADPAFQERAAQALHQGLVEFFAMAASGK